MGCSGAASPGAHLPRGETGNRETQRVPPGRVRLVGTESRPGGQVWPSSGRRRRACSHAGRSEFAGGVIPVAAGLSRLSGVWGGQGPTELNAPWGCSSLPAARDVVTKRNAAIVMGSLQCPSTGRDGVTGCLRLILGLPQTCVAVSENDTVTCTSCVRHRPPAP